MMGRPGSGRARKASISLPRSATTSALSTRMGFIPRCEPSRQAPKDQDRYDAAIPRCARRRLSLGAGVEERRQPGLKMLGDFLGGAVLGVADGAGTRKTLIAAGNIVGDPREGGAAQHRFVGSDFDQSETRIDAKKQIGR